MRRAFAIALVLSLSSLSGCIANMGELKEALGAVPAPEPTPIVHEPPVAKARADTLDALPGQPIRFSSDGSFDPAGLSLVYGWDFGDGERVESPTASHAFQAPGERTVTLRVVNSAGLADEDTLTLRIVAPDRAPTAAFRVLDARGASVVRGDVGAPLAFDASSSSDPEDSALLYAWSFGDGATSVEPAPAHAYDAPGLYDITLTVQDRAGWQATTSARVAIDAAWRETGAFEAAGADVAAFTFPIASVGSFRATLAFPAQAGLATLQLVVKDAAGKELGRTSETTAPATQGDATREVALGATELAGAAPGAWTVEVLRESGLAPTFALDVDAAG